MSTEMGGYPKFLREQDGDDRLTAADLRKRIRNKLGSQRRDGQPFRIQELEQLDQQLDSSDAPPDDGKAKQM